VTLSMKNNFGIPPNSLYGQDAGSERAIQARGGILHTGRQRPPAGVPAELKPESPRVPEWRVPHVTADLAGCRPIDLAVIDARPADATATDRLLALEGRDGRPMSLSAALASIPANWMVGRRYIRRD